MPIKTFTYTDKKGTYYLEPYSAWRENTTMDAHIENLMGDGWELLNSANVPGHTRVGKTLLLAGVTSGLSLLFGTSRTASKVTLTFKKG